jgi:hypothetical protein
MGEPLGRVVSSNEWPRKCLQVRGHNSASIHETFLMRTSGARGFQALPLLALSAAVRRRPSDHLRVDRNRTVPNRASGSLARFL